MLRQVFCVRHFLSSANVLAVVAPNEASKVPKGPREVEAVAALQPLARCRACTLLPPCQHVSEQVTSKSYPRRTAVCGVFGSKGSVLLGVMVGRHRLLAGVQSGNAFTDSRAADCPKLRFWNNTSSTTGGAASCLVIRNRSSPMLAPPRFVDMTCLVYVIVLTISVASVGPGK